MANAVANACKERPWADLPDGRRWFVADAIGGWKPPSKEKQSTALDTYRHGDEPSPRPNSADAAGRCAVALIATAERAGPSSGAKQAWLGVSSRPGPR